MTSRPSMLSFHSLTQRGRQERKGMMTKQKVEAKTWKLCEWSRQHSPTIDNRPDMTNEEIEQFDLAYEYLASVSPGKGTIPRCEFAAKERIYKELKAIHSPIGNKGRKKKPSVQYTMGI